jgi:hypothetical protein
MDQEKAQATLAEWTQLFGSELDEDTRGILLRGIASGRLSFDWDSEKFNVKLIQAVELQNGEKVESISITEPTVDQMRSANMVKDDFAATLAVLSSASGQPLGVINRLKMRDLSLAGSVLAFFV